MFDTSIAGILTALLLPLLGKFTVLLVYLTAYFQIKSDYGVSESHTLVDAICIYISTEEIDHLIGGLIDRYEGAHRDIYVELVMIRGKCTVCLNVQRHA